MRPRIVHITPANAPEYFIVTVPGHGHLCREFADALDAIRYARSL